ncbi:MAG TPA: NAD(P)-dependent alcohol dehydrogenase [Candidatus Limnocylindrales bacterium]|nr:NAD(P)-dependent alcohol dehydrogenase [Candidatus Limnocylindrales bacterium]
MPSPTMKAALRDRYGPPEVVELREIERPEPEGDQILVRVHAASVNRADLDGLYPRWQFTRLFTGLRAPRVQRIGLDAAGVVEAVGPGATRFGPGDRVFADLSGFGQGAFAEYVCAPERAFAAIPPAMDYEVAAALPHSAVLGLQGLRRRDRQTIKPGDRVMIVGASGNVGPFAVQIAKAMGAHVTAVCSTAKVDFVRSLGADEVIDYTTTDYTRTGQRFDWIYDVDAHHSLLRWRSSLRRGGAYVTAGGSGTLIFGAMLLGGLISRATGRRMGLLLWWKPFDAGDVGRILAMIADGTLKPVLDRRFSLDEVVAALRHVDDGKAQGKVIVTIIP